MSAYPVRLEVQRPERFERVQVLLRFLVWITLGMVMEHGGGLLGALYFVLPILAAVLISQHGGAGHVERSSGWMIGLLDWVVGLHAYMLFVTDRFPLEPDSRPARLVCSPGGNPTVSDALLRLLTAVPHMLLLCLLGVVAACVAVLAAVFVLVSERYPQTLHGFQRDVAAWAARLLVYQAALVEPYPPFSLSEGHRPSGEGGGAGTAVTVE